MTEFLTSDGSLLINGLVTGIIVATGVGLYFNPPESPVARRNWNTAFAILAIAILVWIFIWLYDDLAALLLGS